MNRKIEIQGGSGMRRLLIIGLLALVPTAGYAMGGEGGERNRLLAQGYYGMGVVSPSDLNGIQQTYAGSPSSISAATNYGGGLGYKFAHRWEILARYFQTTAKNLSSSGTGIEVNQNSVWGNLDYYLVNHGPLHFYVGAGVGSPSWTQVITHTGTNTYYTASNTVGYSGQAGLDIMVGMHLSIFLEAGYQSQKTGNITTASGTTLLNTTGANAVADLSGFKGLVGLNLLF